MFLSHYGILNSKDWIKDEFLGGIFKMVKFILDYENII